MLCQSNRASPLDLLQPMPVQQSHVRGHQRVDVSLNRSKAKHRRVPDLSCRTLQAAAILCYALMPGSQGLQEGQGGGKLMILNPH